MCQTSSNPSAGAANRGIPFWFNKSQNAKNYPSAREREKENWEGFANIKMLNRNLTWRPFPLQINAAEIEWEAKIKGEIKAKF